MLKSCKQNKTEKVFKHDRLVCDWLVQLAFTYLALSHVIRVGRQHTGLSPVSCQNLQPNLKGVKKKKKVGG